MTSFRIVEVAVPAEPVGPPSWAVEGWVDVSRRSLVEVLGHDDFVDPPASMLAIYADQKHTARTLLLAVDAAVGAGPVAATADPGSTEPGSADPGSTEPGSTEPAASARQVGNAGHPDAVLGYAHLDLPRTDNHHLAMVEIAVRPTARRRGVGAALWAATEERVRAAGRSVVTSWTSHADEAAAGEEALEAPTGVGRIAVADAVARFATTHGFALEQTERHSTLDLPLAPDLLATWQAQAQAIAGPEYRLVQWTDRTPERWLEPIAELQRRMSVDVPMGGLDLAEEVWDAQRVRDADETAARTGNRYVLSAVEHVPSGILTAFTKIEMPRDRLAVVFQEDTLVHGEHRGRRLGLLVKAANLELLAQVQPEARRVHTWNAGENWHMLAINELMGFYRASTEGAWQRRLG